MSDDHKIAAFVPVTREILIDAGHMGPLGRMDAESERWRRMWHDRPRPRANTGHPMMDLIQAFLARSERTPPPWEQVDPPAFPNFRIFGRRL